MKLYAVVVFLCGYTVYAQTNLDMLTQLDCPTACRIALRQQPTMAEARQRVERAMARLSQARSGYWPTVSLSLGVNRYDPADHQEVTEYSPSGASSSTLAHSGVANSSPLSGLSTEPQTWYQAGANATWLLFSGFQRSASVAAARYSVDEMQAANREAKRQLLYAVTAAFLNAQSAREQMKIAREDAAFNERILQDAIASHKAGRGSLSDELNFRVRANAARSTVIFAKRQLRLARIGLAELMGLGDGELPLTLRLAPLAEPTAVETNKPDVSVLMQRLFDRPDIIMGEAGLKRSAESVRVAKSGYYPHIAMSGSYDARRADDASFESDDFAANAGVVISYDLFSGGLHRAQTRDARAALEQEKARFDQVKLRARRELLDAVARIESAIEYFDLQNQNVKYAQENRELTAKAYQAGQAAVVRLNEAQKDLVAAQVRRTQAIIALKQARNDLNAATGAILQSKD